MWEPFRLSIEQRARQIGLLASVGFRPWGLRRLMLGEGMTLAIIGAVAVMTRGLLIHYAAREAESSPPANPLAASYARQLPPEPRLHEGAVAGGVAPPGDSLSR